MKQINPKAIPRVLLAALALALISATSIAADDQCDLSAAEIEKNLGLEFSDFDQNPELGWRPYYTHGCYASAGILIEKYMAEHPAKASDYHILPFHAGQMFALSGNYEKAISLMERAHSDTSSDLVDWNAFVNANVAFLLRDLKLLKEMRERINLQPPMPESPDIPSWAVGKKMNLDVVDGFLQCFEKTYEEAYSEPCRE
jgi:hypothetical protein